MAKLNFKNISHDVISVTS